MKILTVDCQEQNLLRVKAVAIDAHELTLAKEISRQLYQALEPHFPAAGLAAPQIGISKAIFIFSYDRDPKNLETVINPSFSPLGEGQTESWEGCFSTILCEKDWKIALVNRYNKIRVSYLNLDGRKVEADLDGFASRVFQHEYDHLQGLVNIDRPDALVKSFGSKEEMNDFLMCVKNKDAADYKSPN